LKKQIEAAGLDDSIFKRQQAIISSMTKKERRAPKLLNASRKKRVAAGSGTSVQEINKLLKMHLQMADMMKKMGRGKGGLMGGMGGMMGRMLGGGMGGGMPAGMPDPSKMDPAELERLAKQMGMSGGLGGGMPGGLPGGLPKLPGMGGMGGFPGLPKGNKK